MKNKRVCITGGSRGIGFAIASAFAAEGAELVITARNKAGLELAAEDLREKGSRVTAIPMDVSDRDSVDEFEERLEKLGPIHVLVNNAGIAESVKVASMDDDHWDRHLAINLTGAFWVTRASLPAMIETGWGRVINIASTAGKVGFKYTAAYCASKHGLLGFTRALALELAETGITVNAICPGFVETEMANQATANIAKKTSQTPEEARRWLESLSPQKRLIQPSEVAALALMLATDEAKGINGQAINVDGGAVVY